MKNMLIYLKKYRVHAVVGPLFKLFEALLELSVPLVVAAIADAPDTIKETTAKFTLFNTFFI